MKARDREGFLCNEGLGLRVGLAVVSLFACLCCGICSAQGTVSLLVFFDGPAGEAESKAMVLASSPETQRLQAHDLSGVLGFNWGIDPATPQRVHEAQSGLKRRPAEVDHDALADSTVEHGTIYHFYATSNWFLLDTAD